MSNATPIPNSPTSRSRIALLALLGAGLLLAVTTNLAKVAGDQGIKPLAYLTWSLVAASLILLTVSLIRGRTVPMNQRAVEYYVVAALLTVAGSNLIFFSAVGHLGVSFIALMFSLPPLLTYAGALALRMETLCRWRAGGVALALVGTLYLVFEQWTLPESDPVWIAITLSGPVILSAGNLYRSRRWPPGASAESLAPGMLVGAIGLLVLFAGVTGSPLALPAESAGAVALVIGQGVIFAGQFFLLFLLQKEGGPVFLSLMGGVSAVFAVPIALWLLAEPMLPAFLPSAGLIAAGITSMLLGVKACQQETHFSRPEETS